MAQKIANHVDENTPHKDRLVLVALVAVLAFQVVNTYLLAANVDVVSASLALS